MISILDNQLFKAVLCMTSCFVSLDKRLHFMLSLVTQVYTWELLGKPHKRRGVENPVILWGVELLCSLSFCL